MNNNNFISVKVGVDPMGIGCLEINNNGLSEQDYDKVLHFLMNDLFNENPKAKTSLSDRAYNAYLLALQDIQSHTVEGLS